MSGICAEISIVGLHYEIILIQKLEYGSWNPLRKPFESYRMFQCRFPYILTNLNAHSLFRYIGYFQCNDTNTPFLYRGSHENEKS